MHITHHGGASGVTGSCHQLHLDAENSVLVDCGLFQGADLKRFEHGKGSAGLAIEFDVSTVKALLVTHAHIDHVGRLPYLLAAGFEGPVIATEATAAMLPLVIEDALKVGVTRNASLIQACLSRLKRQLVPLPYKEWHSVELEGKPQLRVKFQMAGHILGSAYIECDVAVPSGSKRVVFSGDLGAPYAPLLLAPQSPYRADLLVLESTYGNKVHEGRKQRSLELKRVIEKAIADNGVVVVPAFSMGRTQELLYELEHLLRSSEQLAALEVIVDSPMAAKFTDYYRQFKKLWDAEAKQRLAQGRHPLSFDSLYTVNSHQEHLATLDYLARRKKPAIVIAASGMCSGGRVVNYLKRFLPEKTADVIFVGYQAEGTAGRDIQRYGSKAGGYVMFDGERVMINAGVHTISGYSAHADQNNLVNFVKRIRKKPQQILLVHGEEKAQLALKSRLGEVVRSVDISTSSSR